jgi:hypothetical protein
MLMSIGSKLGRMWNALHLEICREDPAKGWPRSGHVRLAVDGTGEARVDWHIRVQPGVRLVMSFEGGEEAAFGVVLPTGSLLLVLTSEHLQRLVRVVGTDRELFVSCRGDLVQWALWASIDQMAPGRRGRLHVLEALRGRIAPAPKVDRQDDVAARSPADRELLLRLAERFKKRNATAPVYS